MSRLGKKPMSIPAGTEVKVSDSSITVKGPQGTLTREVPSSILITVKDGTVSLVPKKENQESSILWGTYASHVFNMLEGVNKPFEKRLLIEGVGFKADVKGNEIIISAGYSHPVALKIPEGLKIISDKNGILVSGINIEAVGDFAARIRAVKKPEPYKGKGIRYSTEVIKRKQGKKTA